jgi:hypothetical protein
MSEARGKLVLSNVIVNVPVTTPVTGSVVVVKTGSAPPLELAINRPPTPDDRLLGDIGGFPDDTKLDP